MGPIDGVRLLLVEDEYLLALCLAELVQRLGAVPIGPVATVDEALALIRDEPRIDAAGLDVNLGGEPVFPVADALRARAIPFVFASGYDAAMLPEDYRDVAVCPKPIDARAVTTALASLRGDPPLSPN